MTMKSLHQKIEYNNGLKIDNLMKILINISNIIMINEWLSVKYVNKCILILDIKVNKSNLIKYQLLNNDNKIIIIHGELCQKNTSDHTNKWYMHNPESVQENDRDKTLRDLKIKTMKTVW